MLHLITLKFYNKIINFEIQLNKTIYFSRFLFFPYLVFRCRMTICYFKFFHVNIVVHFDILIVTFLVRFIQFYLLFVQLLINMFPLHIPSLPVQCNTLQALTCRFKLQTFREYLSSHHFNIKFTTGYIQKKKKKDWLPF